MSLNIRRHSKKVNATDNMFLNNSLTVIKKFTTTIWLESMSTVNTWQRLGETPRRLKSLQMQHVAQRKIAAAVVPVLSFAA